MKTNNEGLRALTTSQERKELRAIGKLPTSPRKGPSVRLQYLKGSKGLGLRLWNVLTPVDGYATGPNDGVPTFSLDTLKLKGLI
jgi:hypothetical protein